MPLFNLICLIQEVSGPAAEALVNLSQNQDLAGKMVEMGIIKNVIDILYKQGCDITHLLVMLLVNLTQLDVGIESLLQVPFITSLFYFSLPFVRKVVSSCTLCCKNLQVRYYGGLRAKMLFYVIFNLNQSIWLSYTSSL